MGVLSVVDPSVFSCVAGYNLGYLLLLCFSSLNLDMCAPIVSAV